MDKNWMTPSCGEDYNPAEQLNELFTTVFNEILKIEECSLRTSTNEKISVTEVHTLDAIANAKSGTMSEVSSALRITMSTLTVSVTRLEKKQLVKRSRGTYDRRMVYVSLTQEGKRLVEAHRRFHRRMIHTVIQNLDEKELQMTVQAIGRLQDFFNREAQKTKLFLNSDEG